MFQKIIRVAALKLCQVPLLFSAQPDLHVPQNRDRLSQRDLLSVCRYAGNVQDWRLGYSEMQRM